ncbi:unnamed protein product [Vitrella brassicaformis CCMP3155]|uniref:Uncharacterized protein n=1 Tax=Vitrella brassicaformis (strain CCMP3155) TaxID=1169540 RepID=A0A0G4FDX4_VITBC|nr:unnamed protein product [Vitrella brassicaformis CCMP3155]|eukprot:CEM11159.1 unnamed protein product [Vitrella brassicaformis CCMP3155]
MAAIAAAQMIRAQLLPQVQGYRLKQAQVNSCIDQLLQMDTAASMTPLMVDKVSRQFAAVSELLAELAETINSTIALTRHRRTQARRLHLTDIPAGPMSNITALSDLITVAHLKATARPIRNALRPIIRRIRLPKAIEVARVGGLVQFDNQLSHGDVMKAMWVVEEGGEGGWGEVAETLRFGFLGAAPFLCAVDARRPQCGLPPSQWPARRRTQLFRHNNNEIRVIRNEPNFAITLSLPLPRPNRPVHPFSQHPFTHHAKPHDPPVCCRMKWDNGVGWVTIGVNDGAVDASASCMLKRRMLAHRMLAVGGFTDHQQWWSVRRGHLDRIITQSPHTPLDECSDVLAWEWASKRCVQTHVLTTSGDPFIACIFFVIPPCNYQDVRVYISTTEAPAAGVPHDAPFAQGFPRTAAKVRRVLGPITAIVLDGQAP